MRLYALFVSVSLALFLAHAQAHLAAAGSCSGTAVIQEMNLARQHPDLYASYITHMRAHLHGNILVLPSKTFLRTHEGASAIDEAVRFLQRTQPLPPLIASAGMSRAAAEHVADQADGGFGHGGSDFSSPSSRLNHYGVWSGGWGENISYGKRSARDIVIALIIDDGQRGRKHRKNIFNSAFRFAGAAVGRHARFGTVCSMEFAAGYTDKAASAADALLARN